MVVVFASADCHGPQIKNLKPRRSVEALCRGIVLIPILQKKVSSKLQKITQPEASDHDVVHSVASENVVEFRKRKILVFARNCQMLAERVAVGQMRLIDAADMLQSAAELSGLCEAVGDDLVQQVLASAFAGNPEGLSS